MANLSKQTRKVSFIIQCKGLEDYECFEILQNLQFYFSSVCDDYYLILHNQDYEEFIDVNGELKRNNKNNHIHCVCNYHKEYAKTRLQTHLNNLSTELKLNPFAITINYARDFVGNVRYLIHKDSPNKFQYLPTDILTNNKELLDIYLSSDCVSMSTDFLVSTITNCGYSKIKIMNVIGITNYRLYRPTICDIINELKGVR